MKNKLTEQERENILQIIEQEGLAYAITDYTDVFKENSDKKLHKMVDDFKKLYEEIDDYIGTDE